MKNLGEEFVNDRQEIMRILQKEAELKDIVQLVGAEALPDEERIVLEIGRMIREDFLRQSAFGEIDAYTSLKKQAIMLATILEFRKRAQEVIKAGVGLERVLTLKVREDISRMKEVKEEDATKMKEKISGEIRSQFNELLKDYKQEEVESR